MLRVAVFHLMAVLLLAAAVVGSPAGIVPHSEVNITLAFSRQNRV